MQGEARLHHGVGAFGVADAGAVVFQFDEVAAVFEQFFDVLAGGEPVLADEDLRLFVEFATGGEDVHDGQMVALPDFVVVGVVGGGDFEGAGAELPVHVSVGDDGDGLVDDGDECLFADEVLEAAVAGVDGDGGVGHDGFGALCGDDDAFGGVVFQRVAEVKELGVFVFVDDFFVGKHRLRFGVPVGHAQAAVDFSFFIKVNEDVEHGLRQAGFHGEAGALPIAGGAEFFELVEDNAAVFFFPAEGVFQEFLS